MKLFGDPAAATELIERARRERAPVIEGDRATFVWLGERAPDLAGDMTGWQPWQAMGGGQRMDAIARGVWAHTLSLPVDAYMEYAYFVDGRRVIDPLNPRRVPNGFGATNNYFAMPQAPRTGLVRRRRNVKAGLVVETVLRSGRLAGGRRKVRLYQPPTAAGPCPLLLVLDGQDYVRRARLPTILDNLIDQGRIRPLAAAFLDNAGSARLVEYGASEALVSAVAQELLPWVADRVSLSGQPGSHGVLGASMGGLSALWLAARLPELFGSVFSQAGAFSLGAPGELGLTTIVRLRERLPLRCYLDCGRFDPLLGANRAMAALLEERGYPIVYREYNAGHNYPAWREGLAAGLEWLFGPDQPS